MTLPAGTYTCSRCGGEATHHQRHQAPATCGKCRKGEK